MPEFDWQERAAFHPPLQNDLPCWLELTCGLLPDRVVIHDTLELVKFDQTASMTTCES